VFASLSNYIGVDWQSANASGWEREGVNKSDTWQSWMGKRSGGHYFLSQLNQIPSLNPLGEDYLYAAHDNQLIRHGLLESGVAPGSCPCRSSRLGLISSIPG